MRMRLSGGGLLSILAVAFVGAAPTVAGAHNTAHTHKTAHKIKGAGADTTMLNTATGQATTTSAGHLSHVGHFTGASQVQFVPDSTDPSKFSFSGTNTLTAANGDKLFATVAGSGVDTSATTSQSTVTFTITGGTGRFKGASGTVSDAASATLVGVSGTEATYHQTDSFSGTFSY